MKARARVEERSNGYALYIDEICNRITSFDRAMASSALLNLGVHIEPEFDELVIFHNELVTVWVEGNEVSFTVRESCNEDGLPIPKKSLSQALKAWRKIVTSLAGTGVKFVCDPNKSDNREEKRVSLFRKLGFSLNHDGSMFLVV